MTMPAENNITTGEINYTIGNDFIDSGYRITSYKNAPENTESFSIGLGFTLSILKTKEESKLNNGI